MALLIKLLLDGQSLKHAIQKACEYLLVYDDHKETMIAIQLANHLSNESQSVNDAIKELGEGWIAEEALAIAIYCCLKASSFEEAVVMAVNHDGDSDSTGTIAGNILGAVNGLSVIPKRWLNNLEFQDEIDKLLAKDLYMLKAVSENNF